MSSSKHDVVFTVPLDDLGVRFGRLRLLPWTMFLLLLVSVFVQIVVNGIVEQHDWLDRLAIGTVIGLPVTLVASVASMWWFGARDAEAFAREVLRLGGVTVTRPEATVLMSHALRISTHWVGRDVREPAPEYDVPLTDEVGTSLHLSYAPRRGYQMTVVRSDLPDDAAGDGCETCRTGWNTRGTIDHQLGVTPRLQTYLYRCVVCQTYWESVISAYPRPISARQAMELSAASDFLPD